MEECRPKIWISVTFAVWSLFLLKDSDLIKTKSTEGLGPPSLETFENYDKYINVDNNNYLNAHSYHKKKCLIKREAHTKITPKIFKFGVEDAKEPDEATKEIIRKHHAQELKSNNKIVKRIKRRAPKTEPRFIKFDVSDAKEPDEITKELIRQNKARELKTIFDTVKITTTLSPQKQTNKRKRSKRSTQLTQPQFIKFELADAREPKENIRELIQNMQTVDANPMYLNSGLHLSSNVTGMNDDSEVDESESIFYHQSVPLKPRRITNSVPIEVKKIIDLMLRDNKALAYYKHITSGVEGKVKVLEKRKPIITSGIEPQLPVPLTSSLVTIYQEPAYVPKLVPIPIPENSLPSSLQSNPSGPSTNSETDPYTEHNKDFYYPYSTFPQPHPGLTTHQHSSPYLKVIPTISEVVNEIPRDPAISEQEISHLSTNILPNNEISKSFLQAQIIPMNAFHRYGKRLNTNPKIQSEQLISLNDQSSYKVLDVNPKSQSQRSTHNENEVNKEQQQNALNNNQEFQELSSLIGKSPTDQIHGLAYLLAKEMQRNKRLKIIRPQDNTSPILFHPGKHVDVNNKFYKNSSELSTQPESISHPVSEQLPQSYPIPIQPMNQVHEDSLEESAPLPPHTPPPTSYSLVKNLGLSPNYEGIGQFDEPPKIHPDVENELGLQYASKYAFGYRVRDFYSGNDFGHKQNRDLNGVTRGQYHILLPDGRVQNVIYHADDTGFHADVSFETGHH